LLIASHVWGAEEYFFMRHKLMSSFLYYFVVISRSFKMLK
jgi:hypothetical protein